jgi:hypothetical protein
MEKELLMTQTKHDNESNIILEQYKMLVESINKINDTRESSNGFWVATNGVGVSILAYLRDSHNIGQKQISILLLTLIILGIIFSLSWISYLSSIKKALDVRCDILVKLENSLPVPIFSKVFFLSNEKTSKAELTVKEMLVPGLFFISYILFAIFFFFYPQDVIETFKKE